MNFNENPETGNGGMFIRPKDGESVKGILRGEPRVFWTMWDGKKSHEVSKDHPDARFRFKINLVVNEDGQYKAKIFENGPQMYNDLKALTEDYDLEQTVIKITRKGTGLETRYNVMPLPKPLDANQLAAIDAVELQNLEGKKLKNHAPGADNSGFDENEEIDF